MTRSRPFRDHRCTLLFRFGCEFSGRALSVPGTILLLGRPASFGASITPGLSTLRGRGAHAILGARLFRLLPTLVEVAECYASEQGQPASALMLRAVVQHPEPVPLSGRWRQRFARPHQARSSEFGPRHFIRLSVSYGSFPARSRGGRAGRPQRPHTSAIDRTAPPAITFSSRPWLRPWRFVLFLQRGPSCLRLASWYRPSSSQLFPSSCRSNSWRQPSIRSLSASISSSATIG